MQFLNFTEIDHRRLESSGTSLLTDKDNLSYVAYLFTLKQERTPITVGREKDWPPPEMGEVTVC